MNTQKPNVLLLSSLDTPFLHVDEALLRKHFPLKLFIGSGMSAMSRIFTAVGEADVCIAWFASVYAAAMVRSARMLGRKSMIILGGVDAARDPELGYGLWLSGWRGGMVRGALKSADKVVAVDMSLRENLRKFSGWDADKVEYLPTGYDPDFWKPLGAREAVILTVANCNSSQRLKVKGLDLVVEAARRLPNRNFCIIGVEPGTVGKLLHEPLPNLELISPLPKHELLTHYRKAKIYCQFSRWEGLPNTLCEAMLCGCIAIGSDAGGIPTAINSHGFVVQGGNVDALCAAIEKAHQLPDNYGLAGRQHIAANFPLKRREDTLVKIINELHGQI